MKLFIPILFFFAIAFTSYCQLPEEEQGDTLETIVTDTSIIYVIRQKPVTILETVAILQPWEKKKYYLSVGASMFLFSENKKASASHENYLSRVNDMTKNLYGYSIGGSIWRCEKKFYTGMGIDFLRLKQLFNFDPIPGLSFENRFNYANISFQSGYWYRKNKTISYLFYGAINEQCLLSTAGFTLIKQYTEPESAGRIYVEMNYKKYVTSFSAHVVCIVNFKPALLQIEPFFTLAPFSSTSKNEYYSVRRTFVGLKISIANKLF